MLIGDSSKYYLKKIRAKAKMYEYKVPKDLHAIVENKASELCNTLHCNSWGYFGNNIEYE